jgi:RNA polymerase sigma factor for flagellar operon FliA
MDERDDLWDQYATSRDPALREAIIIQNLPLVRHIVGRLAIPVLNGETYWDLVGHGILGLIDAVDRFEPELKWRFSTYAALRVRGHILDALRASDTFTRGSRKRVREIDRAISRLRMELGREPSDEEVADAMGLELETYRAAVLEANFAVLSIDADVDDGNQKNGLRLRETLCDEDAPEPRQSLEETELRRHLALAVERLPRRLRSLVFLYYFQGLTMRQIGQELDLSVSRVSQLHARAMRQLRAAMELDPAQESSDKGSQVALV